MRKILWLVILLIAVAAAASPFRIEPPAPDTRSFVSIVVGGLWSDSCVPHDPKISIAGTTVTIVLDAVVPPGQGCLTAVTKWQETVPAGVLEPGTYNVIALIDVNGGRVELGRTQFLVRDAGPFRALPLGAPVTGGTQIRLASDSLWSAGTTVAFGDAAPVQGTIIGPKTLAVTVPAHAAGTVDVRVGSSTARQAFTFYDPAQPADPSIFEPVLFPLAFSGPGAFGSQWVTDNVIGGDGFDTPVFRDPLPCSGCTNEVKSVVRLEPNSVSGLLLYAGRGTTSSTTLSSRVRDLSRQAESAGTGIPVVREKDWRYGSLRIVNIPADDRGRATLRIWSDRAQPVGVSVIVEVPGATGAGITLTGLTRIGDTGPLFAQIDLGPLSANLPPGQPRSVRISTGGEPDIRLFALVTVTNNGTQQVTAVWPD